MTKQTELMLVEEFSELELEAISGGSLLNAVVVLSDISVEVLNNANVNAQVAAAANVLGTQAANLEQRATQR